LSRRRRGVRLQVADDAALFWVLARTCGWRGFLSAGSGGKHNAMVIAGRRRM